MIISAIISNKDFQSEFSCAELCNCLELRATVFEIGGIELSLQGLQLRAQVKSPCARWKPYTPILIFFSERDYRRKFRVTDQFKRYSKFLMEAFPKNLLADLGCNVKMKEIAIYR